LKSLKVVVFEDKWAKTNKKIIFTYKSDYKDYLLLPIYAY
jgi:hypothetical protein